MPQQLGTEITFVVPMNAQPMDHGGGGVWRWVNNENSTVLITRLVIEITNRSTLDATCNFGAAVDSTTSSDNLISGLHTNHSGFFDNVRGGTKTYATVATGAAVTGSWASGDTADLLGRAYITYILLP